MKHFSFSLIAFLMVLPVNASSDFGTVICSNNKFLNCVGVTKGECGNSYTQSAKTCIKKYPIGEPVENDELQVLFKQYGECTTIGFIKGLHANKDKFEACGVHLETTFDEYRKNAEKTHKLNTERLRKLEEYQ